jgi:hypothetical protein
MSHGCEIELTRDFSQFASAIRSAPAAINRRLTVEPETPTGGH